MELFIGIFIFVFGIIIGSFLNVCIYRIPMDKSVVTHPSCCTVCGARLTALDMIPVFSYLFLRGKCRHCGAKISAIYPVVEALTGVLYVLLYIKFGMSWLLPVNLALVSLLIVISFIDYKHMIIPDGLIIALLITGVIQLAATFLADGFDSWSVYIIGFFAGGVPLLLIALLCMYVLKKEAFGGGDIKLMASAGLIIGWKLMITAYLIGIITGALFSVLLIVAGRKTRKDEIPFGPSLCFGILCSVFFGNWLIDWYLGLL